MSQKTNYDQLQNHLLQVNCQASLAETHGTLCGMLAVNAKLDKSHWFRELFEEDEQPNDTLLLDQLFEKTAQQLSDSNLNLVLVLPDDKTPLNQRLAAAQEWSQGLLYGTAVVGLRDYAKLPKDSREFLQDTAKIVSAGDLTVDEDEESEQQYFEIVEYLRIGTLLLSEELQPEKRKEPVPVEE